MNLKKNVAYNFIYQLLVILIPFVTAPYLSRTIGADGVGTYSYAYSIALYFTYFTLLGLTNYGNRAIAAVQDDAEKRSKLFFEIYTMQFICFIFCAFVYFLYCMYIASDRTAAICMGIFVLSSIFDINWFFFGMEQFKISVIRNALVKISAMLAIFIFVKTEEDIYKYVIIMAMSYLVSQISIWPFLRRFIRPTKIKLWNVIAHFKPNLALFIPVISVSIYKIMDKIMLGTMTNMTELGYYENAERIITVPVALITAVGTVMLPRVSNLLAQNRVEESKKYFDTTMIIVLAFANAAMLGIMAIGVDFSIWFYGSDFERTGIIMGYLAITILFLAVGNVVRTQFLIPSKMDKVYICSACLGAVVNLLVNMLLIPKFMAVGAAVGTILAEFSVCAYQLIFVRKDIKIIKYLKDEMIFLCFAIVMYCIIYFLPSLENQALSVLYKIFIGGASYILLSCIYIYKCHAYMLKSLLKNSTLEAL